MEIWETNEWKLKAKDEKLTTAQIEYFTHLVQNIDFGCMSKLDISNLISTLSRFQNCYALCDKHIEEKIGLFEFNELDWCSHNCDIDVHDCEFWKNKGDNMNENEAYEEMQEVWYHKKLGKLATWLDWSNAYESGICDNGPGDRLQILKQDAWVEKSFDEWQNKHLTKILNIDMPLFGVYADVVADVVIEKTSNILTCVLCGETIPQNKDHYVTGLSLKENDHGMIAFCDPRHFECEIENNGLLS